MHLRGQRRDPELGRDRRRQRAGQLCDDVAGRRAAVELRLDGARERDDVG
jgi:hypothetical protein